MAKFKAGDKVRILDVSYIGGADAYFKNGDTTHAISVDHGGNPYLYCNDGDYDDGLYITDRELDYLELITETYRAEKRKANVGERILITNRIPMENRYKNGDVFTVSKAWENGNIIAGSPLVYFDEYEVIVADKPKKSARITALESQVAELQAKVEALEQAKFQTFIPKPRYTLTELLATYPTPNEQRKAVIERAKVFVKDTINEYQLSDSEISFVIDEKKRSVSVTLSHLFSRLTLVKAIAKCDPSDVFNADIGKAIALGRALGLDVSEFENAVKPTEVVVGHTVESVTNAGNRIVYRNVTKVANNKIYGFDPHKGYECFMHKDAGERYGGHCVNPYITDDTNAEYV